MNNELMFSSKNVVWETPQAFFEELDKEFSFTLDAAANEENAKCARFFTEEDDGLAQSWKGETVWLNPPPCDCSVKPIMMELDNENTSLHTLQNHTTKNFRVLLSPKDVERQNELLVPNLFQGSSQNNTSEEASRPALKTESACREKAICDIGKGTREETRTVSNEQSLTPPETSTDGMEMVGGRLVEVQANVGESVRLLREYRYCLDTGSFRPALSSFMSWDSAREYGASLSILQLREREITPKGLVKGRLSICLDCGEVGYSYQKESVVFCNPPYARKITGMWVEKAFNESLGATVVLLLPARTDTKFFHEFCLKGEVRFIKGRLKFGGCKDAAPFPSMLVIFRKQTEANLNLFGDE